MDAEIFGIQLRHKTSLIQPLLQMMCVNDQVISWK